MSGHETAAGTVLPDITIRQLEYLVAVEDSPSWSVAAERVGVSASALSQGLAELERRIGIPLFDRHGRRRLLRDDARPVLDHARRVIALTTDLARWSTRERSGTAGSIRLGMIDVSATIHHADALRRFRRDRADVDLHLTVAPSGQLLDAVARGQLDAAVVVAPPEIPTNVEIRRLLDEELSVYAPPDAATSPVETWGPWVLFPVGSHTRATVIERLRSLGAPVEVTAVSHQPDVLAEMVRLGLGWSVLPDAQASREDPPLRRVRSLGARSVVVATRAGAMRSAALGQLLERLGGGGVEPASTAAS